MAAINNKWAFLFHELAWYWYYRIIAVHFGVSIRSNLYTPVFAIHGMACSTRWEQPAHCPHIPRVNLLEINGIML